MCVCLCVCVRVCGMRLRHVSVLQCSRIWDGSTLRDQNKGGDQDRKSLNARPLKMHESKARRSKYGKCMNYGTKKGYGRHQKKGEIPHMRQQTLLHVWNSRELNRVRASCEG